MVNYIKRWHETAVQKIADTFALPDKLNHHHHVNVRHEHIYGALRQHNQRVAEWHTQHKAEILSATGGLRKWEGRVYKTVCRMMKITT